MSYIIVAAQFQIATMWEISSLLEDQSTKDNSYMKDSNKKLSGFTMVVTSERKVFDLNLAELIRYRDLIFLFVKREFVAKYKQTVLGPLWAIIQPLLTTIVFTVIFGNLAGLTTSDSNQVANVPTFLFYMSGTIIWNYFSSVVEATSNTFIGNSHIMGKVYFPRLVIPISTTLSSMISFGIRLALFILIYTVCLVGGHASVSLSPYLLMLPLVFLQLMILSMSLGIIISAMTTKYRDLAMLVGFGLQLWHYATPVAYGLQLIPEKWIGLYMINPVTPAVLTFRCAVFGVGYFDLRYYLIGWIMTLVLLFIGVLLFNRIEKTFMDSI